MFDIHKLLLETITIKACNIEYICLKKLLLTKGGTN